MLVSNTIQQKSCTLARRLGFAMAIALLLVGFVPAIALSSDSSDDKSNELIVVSASPSPQESATPPVNRTDIDPPVLGPNSVVIAITEDKQFYVNKNWVERNDISQRVSALLKDRPAEQQIVYIKVAATVRYDTVVSIIDSMREIGIEQIGLVADKRGAKSTASQQRRVTRAGRRVIHAIQTSDELVVTVKGSTAQNQRVEVSSMALPLTELSATLREVLGTRTNKAVFIKAPRQSLYQDIVRIIDAVKAAGAKPVSLC